MAGFVGKENGGCGCGRSGSSFDLQRHRIAAMELILASQPASSLVNHKDNGKDPR